MYVIVWQFEVRPGCESEFEETYGSSGAWAQFFKEGDGYVRTHLLRDINSPSKYFAMDQWSSREDYQNFRNRRTAEYEKLDAVCSALTESEIEIGTYEELDGKANLMEQPHWVKLMSCNYGYESDMIREIMQEAGIPTLAQGPQAGVFGFGFGGPTPQGITVSVPSDRLDEAKKILEEQSPV